MRGVTALRGTEPPGRGRLHIQLHNRAVAAPASMQQPPLVVGAEKKPCQMGYGKSDEGHGATEGGHGGCEQTCDDEQPVAGTERVDANAFCILPSQEQGVEGLDIEQGGGHERQAKQTVEGQHVESDAGEVAHAPNHVVFHALIGGGQVEHSHEGAAHVAHHHAGDEEHRGRVDPLRHGHQSRGDRQGA